MKTMTALAAAMALLALAGCSSMPAGSHAQDVSPCLAGEASYACQVERYNNVNVD